MSENAPGLTTIGGVEGGGVSNGPDQRQNGKGPPGAQQKRKIKNHVP